MIVWLIELKPEVWYRCVQVRITFRRECEGDNGQERTCASFPKGGQEDSYSQEVARREELYREL